MKICTRCKRKLPLSDFHKRSARPCGLAAECRLCKKQRRKKSYAEGREKELQGINEYYRANAEYLKGRRRARRKEKTPEENYRLDREQREKHRERYRLQRTTEEYREKKRIYDAEYRKKFPEKVRERCRRDQASRWFAVKTIKVCYDQIYTRDRGICCLCLRPVPRGEAEFDHIVPISRGGEHNYENVWTTHGRCNRRKWANIVPRGAFAEDSHP